MKRAVKIAISLPAEVLEAADRERRALGETRSAFIRRAVEGFLGHQREREAIEQYVRGYTEQPESAEEIEGLYRAGLEALAQEPPWEEE